MNGIVIFVFRVVHKWIKNIEMKRIISIILIFTSQIILGQNIIDKTFKHSITEGFSTAPDFVVITVKNSNNGKIKEICTDVISLYWSLQKEYDQTDYSIISDSLLNHTTDRFFVLKNKKALERLYFKKYNNKSVDKIDELIKSKKLVDSLEQITKLRLKLSDRFYIYQDIRVDKINFIQDSISNIRELNVEEKEMLNKLDDQYYDYHYNEYYWNKLSDNGKELIKVWNVKIKKDKDKYSKIERELEIQEKKFFRKYYDKYGINFCHALFLNGVTCYQDCENGEINFGEVITRND